MTIAFPGYVPDVTALTDRIKAEWGNAIRDRAPQVFTTLANLASAIPSPQVGQYAIITTGADAGTYTYFGGAWVQLGNATSWRTYTPTLANGITSPASRFGHYWVSGKLLHVVAGIVCGGGTTIAANPSLEIPSGMTWGTNAVIAGKCKALDNSTSAIYVASCYAPNNNSLRPKTGADGNTNFSGTVPFTWATDDTLYMSAWGEIA